MLIDYILSDSNYDKEAEKNAAKDYNKWNSDIDNILTNENFLDRDLSPDENLLNACWTNLENGLAKVNTSNYNLIEKWAEKSYLSAIYFAKSDIMKSERMPRQKEDEAYSKGLSQFIDERIYKCWKLLELCFSDYMLYIRAFCPDDKAIYKALDHYCTLTFNKATEIFPPNPPIEGSPGNFVNLPTSSPLILFNDIIGSGKSLSALQARKQTYSHRAADELKVRGKDGKTAIVQTKEQSKTIVILDTLDSLTHNVHQRKIARHILRLANEQCFFNGIMSRFTVEFPLDDLIGDSLYMNNDTARVGFVRAMAALQAPAIMGYITKKSRAGKEEEIKQAKLANLFIQSECSNNICKVWLNPYLNWNFLLQYFTIIPSYYMQLTDKASDLLEHIFIQARQNEAAIKAGKPFNISFRSICYKLGIPTEEEVKTIPKYQKRYSKHIVEPLNDTIKEIIAKNDKGYSITVHSSGYSHSNISEYLNTGYLEIAIKKDSPYYDPLTKMISRKEQFIQENIEKQERKEINTAVIMKERAEKKKKK